MGEIGSWEPHGMASNSSNVRVCRKHGHVHMIWNSANRISSTTGTQGRIFFRQKYALEDDF